MEIIRSCWIMKNADLRSDAVENTNGKMTANTHIA